MRRVNVRGFAVAVAVDADRETAIHAVLGATQGGR
jgi:hypothetical protein